MDPDPTSDDSARIVADPDNRFLVTAVEAADGPVSVEALARRLVDRRAAVVPTDEYETRVERATLELHHDRLPRLADAGLIEYDPEANVATRRAPALDASVGGDGASVEAVVEHLRPDRAEDDATGTLDGRESIIRYGRRLADEAEEELFCMYVDTDLLEAECIGRAAAALDRGVEMYVGSGNASVRDLTRRSLPRATIWEPQLDWLNPPSYPRVGRLVLVDRRKLMLAVLEAPPPDGTHPDERAVVAEGADHPLVVLVRELMGSRLDHLDRQSADFRGELSSP